MLLPSLVLAVTEPMTGWVRAASVLLPLAAYMMAFCLRRKPGLFLLLCFVLLLINGYQLVLIYLFSEAVISPDSFLNIVTTDSGESGELMRTIWPAVLAACVLYFGSTALAVISVIRKQTLSWQFVKRSCLAALIPAAMGAGCLVVNHAKGLPFSANHNIYPLNALYNLKFAVDKYAKIRNYPQTSAPFTFEAVKAHTPADSLREVVVLVIGETTRAANLELYGYNRPTNPHLAGRRGLTVFTDMLTQGNATQRIVPMILSNASAEDFDVIYTQKSVTTAFKESGFKTFFLSNQVPDRAFIDYFAAEADSMVRLRDLLPGEEHPYDNEGLPFLARFIEQTEGPLFIVYHTYGAHFEYSQRFPADSACFTPYQAGALRYKERPAFVNAYDNAICNVDRTLAGVIDLLDRPDFCSSMLYMSDHGEDLMDDDRKMFLHCSPVPTYYQLHIPFLAWTSEGFRRTYPEKAEALEANRTKPVSTRSVFHSLLDLADINTPYRIDELSVASEAYLPGERHFLDEHDDPVSFLKIGLKEQDFEKIRQMGIQL
jgi:glucan phosphoethanolaminetransferase (alkaline phosphatase superfamily)